MCYPGVTIDDEHVVLVNIQDTLIPGKSDGGDQTLTSVIHEPKTRRCGRPIVNCLVFWDWTFIIGWGVGPT